jgi:phosphate/phosphite/phosphonate ABC transporter binding protein
MSEPTKEFSLSRLLMLLVPIIAVALAVKYMLPSYEKTAQAQFEANMLKKLLTPASMKAITPIAFKDADGDLLTDFAADDKSVKPEKLVFSYVGPAEESEGEAATWADLVAALSEATGLPVEYKHYKSTDEQIAALASGELHIVGLNTGSVPMAVEVAGFHPVCTLGREDGSFGYTMKLLTRTKGGVADPKDLKGKEVAFTTPDSNSGCKAAVVYLMNDENLLPERDYKWGFTFSHDTSVKELVAGEHDAVPVASDLLDKMVDTSPSGSRPRRSVTPTTSRPNCGTRSARRYSALIGKARASPASTAPRALRSSSPSTTRTTGRISAGSTRR